MMHRYKQKNHLQTYNNNSNNNKWVFKESLCIICDILLGFILFICTLYGAYLHCFHFLTFMENSAMDIYIKIICKQSFK